MTRPSQPREVRIREYEAADAPALAQVFYDSVRALGPRRYTPAQVAAWAPEPPDPARVRARAADGRTTVVALDALGEVVAYADLEPDGHIDHLYCRPEAAGRGVAEMLLDALVTRAVAAGVAKLHVEASELARGLFERKGFAVIHRREFERRGVKIHNYAMERTLA